MEIKESTIWESEGALQAQETVRMKALLVRVMWALREREESKLTLRFLS